MRRMNYKMRRRRRNKECAGSAVCTYSKMETEKRPNQLLQNPKYKEEVEGYKGRNMYEIKTG